MGVAPFGATEDERVFCMYWVATIETLPLPSPATRASELSEAVLA